MDDAFDFDGVRVGEADWRLQRIAAVCWNGEAVEGLLRKEADLGPRVHDGAGNVDVEVARCGRHEDAHVEARVTAEGSFGRRNDRSDKRRRVRDRLVSGQRKRKRFLGGLFFKWHALQQV